MLLFGLKMAGEEGFEPSLAGIKTRCLWPLGDSPIGNGRAGRIRTGGELSLPDLQSGAFDLSATTR